MLVPKYTSPANKFSRAGIMLAVKDLLEAMGEDITREGLQGTPERVAKFYEEWMKHSTYSKMTAFTSKYDNMVIVKSVPFYSLCEHHMLPFFGLASIGYIPVNNILGISKLVRILDKYSRRLQVQENLTEQVAEEIERIAKPKGVMVVLEAEHMCMSMRGVEAPGTKTITSCIKGVFTKSAPRQEFLSLIKHNGG